MAQFEIIGGLFEYRQKSLRFRADSFPVGVSTARRNLPMVLRTGGKLVFDLPFAIQDRQVLSDSVKLRTLFVSPHADQRDFFYGVNFELSNQTLKFAQTRFGLEIRPIIGVRNADWEFIVNPIVDIGFGNTAKRILHLRYGLLGSSIKIFLSVWNTTRTSGRLALQQGVRPAAYAFRGNRFQVGRS